MENPIKMDDLGGKPTIFGNTHFLEGWIIPSQDLSKFSLLKNPQILAHQVGSEHLMPGASFFGSFRPRFFGCRKQMFFFFTART